MDIFLSGDIRKDKRADGYVLNPKHYPGIFSYSASTLILTSWPRYYNIVLDSFDYSGNFIERKNGYYDRGTTGVGYGFDFNFNNIGYKHNLYLSGSTNFTGFSGFTIDSNGFSYNDSNKRGFTINGLPNYSGLTTTSATTLFGNVFIKLDIGEAAYVDNIRYTASTSTYGPIILDAGNSYIDNGIVGLAAGEYDIVVDFGSGSNVDFQMFDGPDVLSTKIYEYICGGNFPYNVATGFTVTLATDTITLYNSTLADSLNINSVTLHEIKYSAVTTYELTGKTKNLVQYNIEGNDFNCELYKNNERIKSINQSGKYSDIIDFSGETSNDTWVNLFVKSTDEVRLNNIKLFSLL